LGPPSCRDADADKLLRRYRNDGSAPWLWSVVLAGFRRDGDSEKARKALTRASQSNVYVADYLLGRRKLPRELPALISVGSKDEAIAYVGDKGAQAWAAAPGALAWAEKVLG
jgi:hypothetical protein